MNSINCIGCNEIAQTNAIFLSIHASAGPRVVVNDDNPHWSYSPFPTVTKHIAICDNCLQVPEMRALIEMISPPYSERERSAGSRCVVICRGRKRHFWFAGLRRRGRLWPSVELHRCPSCSRLAEVWPAPLAPDRYVRELQRITKPGGDDR